MDRSEVQPDIGQRREIITETHSRPDTAHPGNFAGAGNAVANRTHPAGAVKILLGSASQFIPFHVEHPRNFLFSLLFDLALYRHRTTVPIEGQERHKTQQ